MGLRDGTGDAVNKLFCCLTVGLGLFLTACGEPEVPGGEITVTNSILDKEYNSFVVDQIMLQSGATSHRVVLKPNDSVTLPFKNIRSMRFTRSYRDYSNIYVVQCPAGFNKKITVKLIDVHTNRVGGGCELVKRGKQEHGRWVQWE